MRVVYWVLCAICIVGIVYAEDVHIYLSDFDIYTFNNNSLIQVVLSVIAGISATKASDSSREIRAILQIEKIDELLGEAKNAEDKANSQKKQLEKLEQLLKSETEAEFARDMIIRHREQLEYHWREILKLESLIPGVPESMETDIELKNRVRAYLIKSRYIDYMGRGFLQSIPVIGSLLHIVLGPVWDEYYYRNMHNLNKKLKATASQENSGNN